MKRIISFLMAMIFVLSSFNIALAQYDLGDVTRDGEINSRDIALMQKVLLDLRELTEAEMKAADINGDGKVNSRDIASVQKHIIGKEPLPTIQPTEVPAEAPTEEPTLEPTVEPTIEPTAEPTAEPTVEPTIETTVEPTAEPTIEPTAEPTLEPTMEPTLEPTAEPTLEPTIEPTADPTPDGVFTVAELAQAATEALNTYTFGSAFHSTVMIDGISVKHQNYYLIAAKAIEDIYNNKTTVTYKNADYNYKAPTLVANYTLKQNGQTPTTATQALYMNYAIRQTVYVTTGAGATTGAAGASASYPTTSSNANGFPVTDYSGQMTYEAALLVFTRVLAYYAANGTLPASVALESLPAITETETTQSPAADATPSVTTPPSQTDMVATAALNAKNYMDSNGAFPQLVTVGSYTLTPAQFLYVITSYIAGQYSSSNFTSTGYLRNVKFNAKPKQDTISGSITLANAKTYAANIANYITNNSAVPNYSTMSLGQVGPYKYIYMFISMVATYASTGAYPSTVAVNGDYQKNVKTDPASIVPESVTATVKTNYASLFAKVNDSKSVTVPGMHVTNVLGEPCYTMVPQGMCLGTIDGTTYMFISAYDHFANTIHGLNEKMSVIYVMDASTGKYLKTLVLPVAVHADGVAFDGENLWVCDNVKAADAADGVASYKLSSIKASVITSALSDSADSVAVPFASSCKVGTYAAFVTFDGTRLWIGNYSSTVSDTFSTKCFAYSINDKTGDSPTLTKAYDMLIPHYVQGMAVTISGSTAKIYTSCSNNVTANSKIRKFTVTLPESGTVTLGTSTDYSLPPMSEGVQVVDGYMYVLFESNAACTYDPSRTCLSARCTKPIDKVLAVEMSYFGE